MLAASLPCCPLDAASFPTAMDNPAVSGIPGKSSRPIRRFTLMPASLRLWGHSLGVFRTKMSLSSVQIHYPKAILEVKVGRLSWLGIDERAQRHLNVYIDSKWSQKNWHVPLSGHNPSDTLVRHFNDTRQIEFRRGLHDVRLSMVLGAEYWSSLKEDRNRTQGLCKVNVRIFCFHGPCKVCVVPLSSTWISGSLRAVILSKKKMLKIVIWRNKWSSSPAKVLAGIVQAQSPLC